jgi:hypothetical protein
MKNSNASAKSRGVVLFAFNTDSVNYIHIAEHASRLIRHTLNLPVTLITEAGVDSDYFDQIVYTENNINNYRTGYAGGTNWRNANRYSAYELSPYDETLLLDSDYLVLDDSLIKILDSTQDYSIITENQNMSQSMNSLMGQINFIWATVVVFKRTDKSRLLFDLVRRIQHNYSYYRKLYNIQQRNFRNDYAFAIADNILNGYTLSKGIPWSMLTLDNAISKIELQQNKLVIREDNTAQVIPRQNIHVIDKDYLQSTAYTEFVEQICQS